MKAERKKTGGSTTVIQFHQGRALGHLAASYPSLREVIPENAQNSVDVDVQATRIQVDIDYRKGLVVVSDNGKGTTVNKFNRALATVATANRKGQDALGQFGIGLISPLGKCERFTFTSRPSHGSDRSYHMWTFNCAEILKAERSPKIPFRVLEDSELPPDCWWSSQMRMEGLTTDRTVAAVNINDLATRITGTIGVVMRRLKTVLSIRITEKDGTVSELHDVKAPEYSGDPLEEHVIDTATGKVTFQLYKVTGRGRRGEVLAGKHGDDFRFPVRCFRITQMIPQAALSCLTSGLFEGEIRAEGVTLKPDRQAFVQDDAMLNFGIAIEQWYDTVGKMLVAEAKDDSRAVRNQELGVRSMKVIEDMLRRPENAHLQEVISGFKLGNAGATTGGTKKARGTEPFDAITTRGGVGVSRGPSTESGDGGNKSVPSETSKEPKDGSPKAVTGPAGQKRLLVRGRNLGLIFEHVALDSQALYEFDAATGRIVFNIRHPAWVMADEANEQAVMRLQEYIAIQILACQAQPASVRDTLRGGIEFSATTMTLWLSSSDSIRRKSSGIDLAGD